MPDVHTVLFEYGDVPVYIRLNLGSSTPEILRFLGSKGILELSENAVTFTPQTGVDEAPSYYAGSFPRAMREEYFKKWHEEHDPKPGQEPLLEAETYHGPGYDEVKPHLARFFQAVRSRQGIVQDAVFGHHAALACHMANESYFRKGPVTLDLATKSIKG